MNLAVYVDLTIELRVLKLFILDVNSISFVENPINSRTTLHLKFKDSWLSPAFIFPPLAIRDLCFTFSEN